MAATHFKLLQEIRKRLEEVNDLDKEAEEVDLIDTGLHLVLLQAEQVVERADMLSPSEAHRSEYRLHIIRKVHDLVFVCAPAWLMRYRTLIEAQASREELLELVELIKELMDVCSVSAEEYNVLNESDAAIVRYELETLQADISDVISPVFDK